MDELTALRTIAACTTVLAAAMVAANLNARVTVAGFAIFFIASVAWIADGWFESKSSLVIQNVTLLLINILGVWRWRPRSEKEAGIAGPETASASFARALGDGDHAARAGKNKKPILTREERRARRELRREKQRKDNIGRAAKMHAARLAMEAGTSEPLASSLKTSVFVGCSGWFYWKWRGLFYPVDLPTGEWFKHYVKRLDTVEINASFYSWPTVANVKAWNRQAGKRNFVYMVKVCELITHIRKFKGTKTLVRDFGMIADILGERMGCFLFQLPPSYRYTKARLAAILGQPDPTRRYVVEFRHKSWWNETVYAAFRVTGTIFCSCSGPRLPDELIRTADDIYLRLHGPERWYRHNYSKAELGEWVQRIQASGAKRAWVYFNNDYEANAPANAATMRRLLASYFRAGRRKERTRPGRNP